MSYMYDDICYECTADGGDYFINEYGELESYCPQCPYNEDSLYGDEE